MATQQTGPVFRSERQREVVEFTCADGADSNGSLWAEQFDAGARLAMRPRGREKRSSHNAQCASLAGRWAATASAMTHCWTRPLPTMPTANCCEPEVIVATR